MSMNRSISFVNALKWWPLQYNNNHNNQNVSANTGVSTIDCCSYEKNTDIGVTSSGNGKGNGPNDAVAFTMRPNKGATRMFGSSVAVQKLRESKWFKSDEQRILCAVIECGFIVELRGSPCSAAKSKLAKQQQQQNFINKIHLNNNTTSKTNSDKGHEKILQQQEQQTLASCQESAEHYGKLIIANEPQVRNNEDAASGAVCDGDDIDDDCDNNGGNENRTPPITSWFGVTLCRTTKDNKPKPETVEIYSVKVRDNGTFRILKMSLDDIWNNGWELRINNFADKEKQAHNEKDIRNQVSFARKAKHSLWHNSKHFAYWCRYGSRQQDVRKRQISECVKWGTVGMNAGIILLMNNHKSHSTSK